MTLYFPGAPTRLDDNIVDFYTGCCRFLLHICLLNPVRKNLTTTVNLADRQSDLLVRHIENLREVTRIVKRAHPFVVEAMVVLPEHLHAI